VARAADDAKPGQGLVYYDPDSEDYTLVRGYKTRFTTDFKPRMQIMLPKSLGYATGEVVEIVDDETLRIKKPFADKAKDALVMAGQRVKSGGAAGDGWEEKGGIKKNGVDYKTMPYIDQTQVLSPRPYCLYAMLMSPPRQMYSQVYKKLKEGGCIGIFPEGTQARVILVFCCPLSRVCRWFA
jgi:glycerol-3-phosphate O-acyltransferase/dihydroxyacetone phosphate acyltransferase